MRIVLLPSAYAPAVGGVEELSDRLAHHLVATGHEVEIWTNRHPPQLPAAEEIAGLIVRRFPMPMPSRRAKSLLDFISGALRSLRAMTAAARRFDPDVLHVQCFSGNGVYASVLSRLLSLPLVVSLQGETVMDDHDIYTHSVWLRFGLRMGLRVARVVTGCSKFTLDDAVARFGLSPTDGIVIPNGVELSSPERATPIDLPFHRYVFALGRVVEKKGFDLLIDSFEVIAESYPDLGLIIGGDGPARAILEARIQSTNLEKRIALVGTLSRGQVKAAMGNAAAFVLPSRIEPFGMVVLEAMRAGTPVIVSGRGGPAEIVRDGVEGLVVDPLDRQAMAAALERLLADGPLRRDLTHRAQERVKAFAWESITQRYVDLYSQVIY